MSFSETTHMDIRHIERAVPSEEEIADQQAHDSITSPCPFCGAPFGSLTISGQGWHGKRNVECTSCGASAGNRDTPAEAVEAWEMRAAKL